MKFGLIDRVDELERGRRIVAVKAVSLSEEYLAEHFPTFPVLPGVFMLECMVEAARWLVHDAHDFTHSLVLLASTSGVTYKSFVSPGQILRVEVTCRELGREASSFSGAGYCGDDQVVKGRFDLTHRNVSSVGSDISAADACVIQSARKRWSLLWRESNALTAEV